MNQQRIVLKTENHEADSILLVPEKSDHKPGVILAHGAGSDMNSEFISYFHREISAAGYPCMKFNFPYSQKKKKVPDPQPVLMAIFRKAIEAMPRDRIIIGGKSMGGRIASYVADADSVIGLLFLGYPLHAPGKFDQLRDQHLYKIRKPMLFLSGTKDPFARPDLFANVIKKLGNYATVYSVEGGGHSLELPKSAGKSQKEILEAVLHRVVEWLNESG